MSLRKRHPGGGPEWSIIQAPELIRRLQNRLGLRQAHIAPALLEGVQPVVVVDSLVEPTRWGEDARPWLGRVIGGGSDTEFSIVQLSNLATTGTKLDLVVKRIRLASAVAGAGCQTFYASLAPYSLPNATVTGLKICGDLRVYGLTTATQVYGGTTGGAITGYQYAIPFVTANDEHVWEPVGLIIPPGYMLRIGTGYTAVGAIVTGSFEWLEVNEGA